MDLSDEDVGLNEAEMDELESLLVSDVVPDDCMSLEMLDGYLAAAVLSPEPLATPEWLPGVWSDTEHMPEGKGVQRLVALVLAYHDEVAVTMGAEDGWEPFCYASEDNEENVRLGDEWMTGFELGLELWDEGWRESLDPHDADTWDGLIDQAMGPWTAEDMEEADDDERLQWLEDTGAAVRAMYHLRVACELPDVPMAGQSVSAHDPASAGRNEPCPCGSDKKYKHCCGADD